MPTTNVYRFVRDLGGATPVESFKCYTSSGVNQGDMVQWDSGALLITANLLASGSLFLGVAEESNPVAGIGTSTNPLTGSRVRVKMGGIHQFKTTTSETYTHMTALYQGADQQTVTTVMGSGRLIGRVWLPDGSSVTGAAGTAINVLILPNATPLTPAAAPLG